MRRERYSSAVTRESEPPAIRNFTFRVEILAPTSQLVEDTFPNSQWVNRYIVQSKRFIKKTIFVILDFEYTKAISMFQRA